MRRKDRIFGKFVLPALMLLTLAASAQDFKIRAKVDLVVVPVTVKASSDKLVTGLTKNDFVVFEDGKPQAISNFTSDPVPLSAAVLLDTGLSAGSLAKVQKTLSALAGAFSDFDEVAVYRYDKFVTKVLDFSHDTDRIQTAMKTINDIKPDWTVEPSLLPGPFQIPGPVINGAAVVPPGQVGVVVTSTPRPSRVLNDALFAAASDLAKRDRDRRKTVLVISDGQHNGSNHSVDETRQSLLEIGAQVFAIAIDQPFPYKQVSVLADYAKTTGGDTYFVDSLQHIEGSYMTATEEARNQYVIGYVSSNENNGPGPIFREIDVAINGRNLKTLHRKGYYQYP